MAATLPPDLKRVVTFIFLPDSSGNLQVDATNGQAIPNGTGFFVTVTDETSPKLQWGYLVTAKHVLKTSTGSYADKVFVRLNKRDGNATFIPINLKANGKGLVFSHSDDTVDIGVVPTVPSNEFDFKMMPTEMLTTKDSFAELHLGEGSDIFFLGLFTGYYGQHRNNPIARFGHVAMFPEDKISWRDNASSPAEMVDLYLVEAQSYGGNSGSPVFFFLGADRTPGSLVVGHPVIKLAGIKRGSFGQLSPIDIMQTPTGGIALSKQNIGIAAVTPSYLLHEILFSDELKKIRAQHAIQKTDGDLGTP